MNDKRDARTTTMSIINGPRKLVICPTAGNSGTPTEEVVEHVVKVEKDV